CGRDAANGAGAQFGEPEVPVRPGGDAIRMRTRRHWVLGDGAGRRDPTNLISLQLGEPEVLVGPGGDVRELAVVGGHGVLGDAALRRPSHGSAPRNREGSEASSADEPSQSREWSKHGTPPNAQLPGLSPDTASIWH